MEEERKDTIPEEATQDKPQYIPRPMWQVWLARVALVLFIIIVIGQILRIARGGL